jgi:putative phosphoesterase
MLIGIIADTHGSLPDAVSEVFADVDRIIHAGDVGSQLVLDGLEAIAPVTAVRGNMDTGGLEWRLPDTAVVHAGTCRILVGHKAEHLAPLAESTPADVIVSGHTHRARVERIGDVLRVDPGPAGSAGRDGRGPTVALLDCAVDPPEARIVDL